MHTFCWTAIILWTKSKSLGYNCKKSMFLLCKHDFLTKLIGIFNREKIYYYVTMKELTILQQTEKERIKETTSQFNSLTTRIKSSTNTTTS
jgi:hypothetical protein